jgi:hypothetical protein
LQVAIPDDRDAAFPGEVLERGLIRVERAMDEQRLVTAGPKSLVEQRDVARGPSHVQPRDDPDDLERRRAGPGTGHAVRRIDEGRPAIV